MRLDDEESIDAILGYAKGSEWHLYSVIARHDSAEAISPRVVARSEIPRLCFGTGSAISVGQMIATHFSGARNDKK